MHCTRCLLFGHGNISCNGCAHCRKCSGYHDTDRTPSSSSPTPHSPLHTKNLTSGPTLAPRPTTFQASLTAPILDPIPAPTKPLSPIISVVPLTAQSPSPKAQRTCHHHKPHHTVTPHRTTRPSVIPKGAYRTDITDAGEFVPQPAAQQPLPSLGSAGRTGSLVKQEAAYFY
ncbi:hypothetical protein E2C01_028215 [Portunus trituberculatus]|uniref:Uncharacterized protein n=1 Tax=Portunus trituberculatus TaxID=210409 RepID=A0A5B7EPF0_PORTR|nr:hypothetical protein [Portunus trituberculatus]